METATALSHALHPPVLGGEFRPGARTAATEGARATSRTLFAALAALEEGTAEYQHVRNRLVELNMALVHFAARRFHNRSEPAEDIVQVGTIGLIKAINRFDHTRDVAFPTFALPTIRGEIMRFLRDTSWGVSVPRRLQELRLRLARARDQLDQELGRSPTTLELAERLQLPPEEVVQGLLASNGYCTRSIDLPGTTADADGTSLVDRLAETDSGMEDVENYETLRPLIAGLPERERTILALRFGQELTQSEIGARLGISQMHVSRLLRQTLEMLRGQLTCEN